MTGPDGRYKFPELPAGDYRVGFHGGPARSALAAEWWQNRGDGVGLAGATAVPVDGEIVAGIRATLDPGGVIHGRLLDTAGHPVEDCVVQVRARDGSLAIRSAVTGATGAFSVGGLSTVSYVVLVPKVCKSAGRPGSTTTPTPPTARRPG